MLGIDLIAQHLDRGLLKIPVVPTDSVCTFTGKHIGEGVRNTDLIKKTFTDHVYLRHASVYSSVEAALCMEAVVPADGRCNSLRNYSYLATEKELRLLKQKEIMSILIEPPKTPFVLCVTYSNKKHTAYKASVNVNSDRFTITTDIGDVVFDRERFNAVLPLVQGWYTVVEGKEGTAQQSTYFTKNEILNGCTNFKRIESYGIGRYLQENQQIEKLRHTAFLKLIVHLLNKTNA